MSAPFRRSLEIGADDIVVDNFAGGGGASTGLRAALRRPVDVAINHSPVAIAMHGLNHPDTHHYCESVWKVDPREVAGSRRVAYVWLSPDCTHFSRAAGCRPRSKGIRSLAWTTIRWARLPADKRPLVMFLENVEEFEDWGPLDEEGYPDKSRKGKTFRAFVAKLRSYGYVVEWRRIVAADHGAPTTRRRLFMVARCDGRPIVWPEATHGKGLAQPWRTAAEVIDWSIPCPSIFGRKKPLAEKTMWRIAAGLKRFVIDAASPFIVPVTHQQKSPRVHGLDEPFRTITAANRGELALVTPFVAPVKSWGGGGNDARSIVEPLRTITASKRGEHALIVPTLIQTGYGERDGQAPRVPGLGKPLGTVVAGGQKHALVTAFLAKHYGGMVGHGVGRPIGTVTAKDRFGLVTVHGVDYVITDVGLRMLAPRELYNAQGFPADYIIDFEFNGRPVTKTDQIELVGNSVCPDVAEAIVAANIYERRARAA